MKMNRRILVVSTLIVSLLTSSFVLFWGKSINNSDMILSVFVIIEIILVIFLSVDILKNIKK
ncbi:hypothetical protein [Romboutsia lituseburensis]|uniref:Uncharacterized protein n=1 Tax=Romboutsia lituseburensis DSM 797 TaxID=1121325 RepID=A0A1G9MNF8_9FIRM|nr:hypothetical protein [Romboutsia lituseburensis]SDL75457.1 hypothetical protein SAMN04515677_103283 [Romboutsia lituseburensis DSM 797]